MSNPITIEPTKFENVRTGESTLGFRAYDSYGATYCNLFTSIPDDDLDFLAEAVEMGSGDPVFDGLLDHIRENECGVSIGNEFYDYNEIKDIIGNS